MKRRRVFISAVIFLMLISVALFATGQKETQTKEKVVLNFWTAGSPNEGKFWKMTMDAWEKNNPVFKINYGPGPAGGSSEEVMLTAIATNTAPDMAVGIFCGFAAQLANNDAVVPLDKEFADFWDVARGRKMEKILKKGWSYKGNQYVLPQYCNPMMNWYGVKLLRETGLSKPPRTYGEFLAIADKIYIPNKRWPLILRIRAKWWDRWFDLFTGYYANSGGAPYMDSQMKNLKIDNEDGLEYVKFVAECFNKGYAPKVSLTNPVQEGKVLMHSWAGPWLIASTKKNYPNFEYIVSSPLVKDSYPADKPIYTIADSKGIIILKSSKYPKESWEFLKWLFGNVQNDVNWMECTTMPVVREDLITNPAFKDFFNKNPKVLEYAKAVPYAVPPAMLAKTAEVQTAITEQLWEPIMYGKKTPEQAIKDATEAVHKLLNE